MSMEVTYNPEDTPKRHSINVLAGKVVVEKTSDTSSKYAEGTARGLSTKCTTPSDIIARIERAVHPEEGEEVVLPPSREATAAQIPPRLPLLEGERAQSDLLAIRIEQYFEQLKTFEEDFRKLLQLPLVLSKTHLQEQLVLFREQLSTIEALAQEHGRLLAALKATRISSRVAVLTPKQKELLTICNEKIGRLTRASRFLINYFDTILCSIEHRVAPTLIQLHKKTQQLALRILSGFDAQIGTAIGSRLHRRKLQILTFGDGFDVVEKSAQAPFSTRTATESPLSAIAEAQQRAFSSLENEIKILILLNGARHVIPHYFARITSRSGRIFLERAESDFQHLIFRRGITRTQLKTILRGALIGLSETHKHHIIHNDIKPENILINEGQAYLCDFGLAKYEGLPCVGGTRYYAAPERLYNTKETTRQSDIWSYGILCFVALTGRYPFPKEMLGDGQIFKTQKRIIQRLKESLSIDRERIETLDPKGFLQEIIYKTLCLDMAKRPPADELLTHPYFSEEV